MSKSGTTLSMLATIVLFGTASQLSLAGFGPKQIEYGVKVKRIFAGHNGPTYVTFTPKLTNCMYPGGGYLTVNWETAHGGPSSSADWERAHQITSMLLYAKATDTPLEVRYRQNTDNPTGWNSCTIDAIFLE